MAARALATSRSLAASRGLSAGRISIPGYKRGLVLAYGSEKFTIPVVPSVNGFCFGFWVKFTSNGNNEGFLECVDGSLNNGFRFIRGAGISIRLLTLQLKNGSTVDASLGISNIDLLKHIYIAVTFVPNSCKIYSGTVKTPISLINTDTSCAMTIPGGALTFGKNSGNNTGSLTVTDFIFKNTTTPWTLQEIQDAAMKRSFPAGLDVRYNFDGQVVDQTGNGKDATLTGGAYSTIDIPIPNRNVV